MTHFTGRFPYKMQARRCVGSPPEFRLELRPGHARTWTSSGFRSATTRVVNLRRVLSICFVVLSVNDILKPKHTCIQVGGVSRRYRFSDGRVVWTEESCAWPDASCRSLFDRNENTFVRFRKLCSTRSINRSADRRLACQQLRCPDFGTLAVEENPVLVFSSSSRGHRSDDARDLHERAGTLRSYSLHDRTIQWNTDGTR